MKQRDSLLDVLKGIGIILVVFAHINNGELSDTIYLFHMPLFFLLSGAALAYSANKNILGVDKYAKSLMIPYFAFSLLTFVYWYLIEWRLRPTELMPIFGNGIFSTVDIKWQEFINIFTAFSVKSAFEYNVVMWFLPCLFCSLISYKLLTKYLRKYAPLGVIILAACCFLLKSQMPYLPWCFEISLAALPFIWIGDKCYLKMKEWNNVGGVILSLLLIPIIIWFFHPRVNMLGHQYSVWWQFYLVALLFIYIIIHIGKWLLLFERGMLQWLGKNSLTIMCIHEPIKRIILKIASVTTGTEIATIRASVPFSILITFLMIVLLIPLIIGINRHAPFLIGKISSKHSKS